MLNKVLQHKRAWQQKMSKEIKPGQQYSNNIKFILCRDLNYLVMQKEKK